MSESFKKLIVVNKSMAEMNKIVKSFYLVTLQLGSEDCSCMFDSLYLPIKRILHDSSVAIEMRCKVIIHSFVISHHIIETLSKLSNDFIQTFTNNSLFQMVSTMSFVAFTSCEYADQIFDVMSHIQRAIDEHLMQTKVSVLSLHTPPYYLIHLHITSYTTLMPSHIPHSHTYIYLHIHYTLVSPHTLLSCLLTHILTHHTHIPHSHTSTYTSYTTLSHHLIRYSHAFSHTSTYTSYTTPSYHLIHYSHAFSHTSSHTTLTYLLILLTGAFSHTRLAIHLLTHPIHHTHTSPRIPPHTPDIPHSHLYTSSYNPYISYT